VTPKEWMPINCELFVADKVYNGFFVRNVGPNTFLGVFKYHGLMPLKDNNFKLTFRVSVFKSWMQVGWVDGV